MAAAPRQLVVLHTPQEVKMGFIVITYTYTTCWKKWGRKKGIFCVPQLSAPTCRIVSNRAIHTKEGSECQDVEVMRGEIVVQEELQG
jgi:hypothetical protein